MAKEITRREFIKGAAAGAISLAALGALELVKNGEPAAPAPVPAPSTPAPAPSTPAPSTPAPAAPAGTYHPGTYSAQAQGFSTLQVTATFSEDAITEVVIDGPGETAGFGLDAIPVLQDQIMAAQSSEIDGVSGATLTSKAVKEAMADCIEQAKSGAAAGPSGDSAPAESASGNPKWLGDPPEISDISETWDTEILIVGAGNGGLAAGAWAARNGIKNFRVIEKNPTMAKRRGWYGAVDSEEAKAHNVKPMDRSRLYYELKRFASGKCNLRTWKTWVEESADMHHFVKECYAKYDPEAKVNFSYGEEARWPEEENYFFPECEHTWSSKLDRHDMFKQVMEDDAGVKIDFNTALVKLEQDASGKVTGVIAQNTDTKKYIRINASKGVLLATGGFPGNPDMMEQLDPLGTSVTTLNYFQAGDTGDGIKAACWIGAALQQEPAPMIFDRGICPPGCDGGYVTTSLGTKKFPIDEKQFNLGTQPFLKVDRHGHRFTNESGTYDMMSYAAAGLPGHVYAEVFDKNMPQDVQRFHTIGCSAQTRQNVDGQLKSFDEQITKGNAFKADTIEELADKLGFTGDDKTNFLNSVKRYNELYDMQDDPDFFKPAYKLSAIKEPPFYGFWMGGSLLTTEQGILVDEKARALDTNMDPIPGLFMAGDCTGGFFYNNYPCLMPGVACGRTMTFGIKAIKVMAGIDK